MAKKREQPDDGRQRQSRKEILIARRQERQNRQVMLAVLAIVVLIGIVILVGVVNEVLLKPSSPVASVNGNELSMREWQERVRIQRAQLIIGLEDLADNFSQDIGQVQQFAGQQISLLEDSQTLGQLVLDQLIDERLVQEAVAERGLSISDVDVQKEIEESFSYFGGELPTPFPTATETVMPTPSLTPIPTSVITEVVPTNTPMPTVEIPTGTPFPTATPVTLDSFLESFAETINEFSELGVNEEAFRELVRAQLYQELLRDTLAEEEGLAEEAEHASFFYLSFATEDEADQAVNDIENDDFLTVWNTVKSEALIPDEDSTSIASEVLWRTQSDLEEFFSEELAETVFDLPLDEPSSVIVVPAFSEEGTDQYFIVLVSGREIRPLSEGALRTAKEELLTVWLEEQRLGDVEIFERWRANVPQRPILDRRFLQPPTPGPPTPTFELPTVEPSN